MAEHATRLTVVAIGIAGLALTVGCSGTVPDRAGGNAAAATVSLDMAVGNDGPPAQLVAWADQVKASSKGAVTIRLSTGYAAGTTDYERTAFRDVTRGKIAMASLGARALDRLGVTAFQALLAPMLVDSYELQASVFAARLPDEMLKSVNSPGVVALAILPGPMRKVLGVNKPFLQVSDFAGTRIGDQDSALTEQTLHALGATAVPEPSGAKLLGVDGYEQQLSSIGGNDYHDAGVLFTTANLNLWPRPIAIVIGSAAYGQLSQPQKETLQTSAKAVLADTLALSRAEDTGAIENLCRQGMRLPTATPQQLTSLRTALDSVYATLTKNADTKSWIDRIQQLKDQSHAAPATATCPTLADTTGSTPIDGAYEAQLNTGLDIRRYCKASEVPQAQLPAANKVELLTVVFDHGTVMQYQPTPDGGREVGWHGTYQVFHDTLQLTSGSDVLTMTWRVTGSTLQLSNLRNSHDCRDAMVWANNPWHKTSQ